MKNKLLFCFWVFITPFAIAQIPANYYDGTAGLTGATLKSQLKQIITNGHQDHGYNGLWTAYQTTDRDYFYENNGKILDIYSENPNGTDPYEFNYSSDQCGNYSNEGDCYNREHIVPQSLFNEDSPMKNDVHFIRATDGKVNGMRSNFPFGKVGTASFTSLNGSKLGNSVSPGYGGTVFEPIDEFKGDVARMIFYFVTRYETQLSGFINGNMLGSSAFPGLQTWELNQLLAWNALDPVSPMEISRNNASYTYQGNRNPYIDNNAFVNLVWGTPTIDTQAPTAPTNLVANNPTANTVNLSWTASTDNIAVIGYDVYANGSLNTTVSGTSAIAQGLIPSTLYNFYVVAKDAAGNTSAQSNIATETTLAGGIPGGSCGTETFINIPTSSNNYATRTWTGDNSVQWTATDARTDQTINGKAITIRNGSLKSSSISGGIGNLTLTTNLPFTSDNASNLNVKINGNVVGTIPYNSSNTTTTINDINISGNIIIEIVNPTSERRISLDDLTWTCYSTMGTSETNATKNFSIYPNPVKNNIINVNGKNLKDIQKAEIFSINGTLIQTINKPFIKGNQIHLNKTNKGVYILKLDKTTSKFILD